MPTIFLSVGSNIEPERHIQQCAKTLKEKFTEPVWSPVYRSAAVGMDGDDFLNAVVMADTEQSIESTEKLLKQIEHLHGRVRSNNKFINRTLDIDLLLYDDMVLDTPEITLPRTETIEVAYILKPLADLAPNSVHPVLNRTYADLLNEFEHDQPENINSLALVQLKLGD